MKIEINFGKDRKKIEEKDKNDIENYNYNDDNNCDDNNNKKYLDNNLNTVEDVDILSFKRSGADVNNDEKIENRRVKKEKIQKYMIGGFMTFLFITTLNLRSKNLFKIQQDDILPIIQNTVKTSSSIDENSYDKDEEKIVLAQKQEDKLIFSYPVYGEIQKMYSPEKVIYSKTLRQWKTHDGIDISANVGRDVLSIERGVVNDIYWDDLYGQTIEIEHLLGYVSVYSNLDENVNVRIGESVVKSQKIGKVGTTAACECSDDSHIHFRLYQNGKIVDPTFVMD